MKYKFQTVLRNLDVQGVGTFLNGYFETDDEEKAARLRKNKSVEELTDLPVESPTESPVEKPKRGRPRGVQMKRGARMSEEGQE